MTRLLAAMQTTIVAAALPMFDRNIDRFIVYVLVLRQSLRGGEVGIPVLSLANSLGLPFETTRRHVQALIAAGMCRRISGGIVSTDFWREEDEAHAVALLSHDCFVRFIEDMTAAVADLPSHGRATNRYEWQDGLQAVADLMLAVADTNSETHRDWLDLVLFSTILHANFRAGEVPAPIRVAPLARLLALPSTTVQRRVSQMIADGRIDQHDAGLTISGRWMASDLARATTAATYTNVRRILAALEAKGFPFEAPARAYRLGRPADPMA